MKIIDAHMHLGEDLMFNTDDSEEVLLRTMEDNGIAALVLQPGIVSRDQRKAHQRIRDFGAANPGKVFGLACFSPYMGDDEYTKSLTWAVRELGFKGVKIHPNAFCMAPSHPAAEKIFRLASDFDIPVMIHTGNGLPNAMPSLCIPVARKYPRVRIVLAHAGGGMFGADAIVVAQECQNVFLETSWTAVYDLAAMVRTIGAERVMFGTDLPSNVPVELAKYKSIGLAEAQLEWCMHKTAEKVFRIA